MKNQVPEYFRKTSVYQVNVRMFSPEGTLKAVTDQLPLIAELGFGIVYLCPIFEEDPSTDRKNWSKRQLASKTENPKNPYRVGDYFEIDSEYGTMQDLRELVNRAHSLGMRVFLDLVYFHTGPNARALKAHPEFAKRNADGSVMLGEWNFPVFDFDNPALREYLYCNMVYYVGHVDVDGFRCDASDFVPLDFWEEGKRRIRQIKPDAVLINEGGKAEYLRVFDCNYGGNWMIMFHEFLHGRLDAAGMAEKHTQVAEKLPEGSLLLRCLDNHDTVTDWPSRVEKLFGNHCMDLVQVFNFLIDGVPMVFGGNELADTASLSLFANRFHPGTFGATDRNASSEAIDRRQALLKKLHEFKKQFPALYAGKTEWLPFENPRVLAFSRTCQEESIVVVGNFSEQETLVNLDAGGEILLTNLTTAVPEGYRLAPYGYIIIRR